jgi:hypothetical protein
MHADEGGAEALGERNGGVEQPRRQRSRRQVDRNGLDAVRMARPLKKARSGVTAQRLRAGGAILPAAKPAHKSALRRLAAAGFRGGWAEASGLYQLFTNRLRSRKT